MSAGLGYSRPGKDGEGNFWLWYMWVGLGVGLEGGGRKGVSLLVSEERLPLRRWTVREGAQRLPRGLRRKSSGLPRPHLITRIIL